MRKTSLKLEEVRIVDKRNSALNTLGAVDIMLRPVNTSQDILRIVPGLFIAQHAGGGKAEQIFLRGYDIDHGTDINITVDGMPVNMVSHAHGQGYADLHFLIPETVEKINFDKGPYFTNKGNLATAGFDRTLRIWDVATRQCRCVLRGHPDDVFAVAFHPTGTRVASSGRDGVIWLWDVETGSEVARLRGHTNYVWSLAFSPDGKTLASGSGDGTVRLWDTEPVAARYAALHK